MSGSLGPWVPAHAIAHAGSKDKGWTVSTEGLEGSRRVWKVADGHFTICSRPLTGGEIESKHRASTTFNTAAGCGSALRRDCADCERAATCPPAWAASWIAAAKSAGPAGCPDGAATAVGVPRRVNGKARDSLQSRDSLLSEHPARSTQHPALFEGLHSVGADLCGSERGPVLMLAHARRLPPSRSQYEQQILSSGTCMQGRRMGWGTTNESNNAAFATAEAEDRSCCS